MHPNATWKAVAEQRPRSPPLAFIGNLFFFLLEMCVRVFFSFFFFFSFFSLLVTYHSRFSSRFISRPLFVRLVRCLGRSQPGDSPCVSVCTVCTVCVCVCTVSVCECVSVCVCVC